MNLGRNRSRRLWNDLEETGLPPEERRGGARKSKSIQNQRHNIAGFTRSLAVRDVHYSRNKSARQYLDRNLGIKKLYNLGKSEKRKRSKNSRRSQFS